MNRRLFQAGHVAAMLGMVTMTVCTPFTASVEASSASVPTLDHTVFIEADADRRAAGYEGYTLSPADNGYRVEIIGEDAHLGTIYIETDSVSEMTFDVLSGDDDSATVETVAISDTHNAIHVDGLASADLDVAADMEHELHSDTFTLMSWKASEAEAPAADASIALTLLRDVLSDTNFRDEFSNYQAVWWIVPVAIVVGAIISAVAIYYVNNLPDCQAAGTDCANANYDPTHPACVVWFGDCSGSSLYSDWCMSLANSCAGGNTQSCDLYVNHCP